MVPKPTGGVHPGQVASPPQGRHNIHMHIHTSDNVESPIHATCLSLETQGEHATVELGIELDTTTSLKICILKYFRTLYY